MERFGSTTHPILWVLESNVFPKTHAGLRAAIQQQGHRLLDWSDAWWSQGFPHGLASSHVLFHGSLDNAARIAASLDWSPGSFCPTSAFCCASWYPAAQPWLLHNAWHIGPANEVIAHATDIAHALGSPQTLFIRPDSPLKPFSGRVVDVTSLTLAALDFGFYFDDETLPIVAAPTCRIDREWRFVIAQQAVITGSAYDPLTRTASLAPYTDKAADFAKEIATHLPPPADVYILDLCETDGHLRLLELNPFGGADLYACDPHAVVSALSALFP